MFEEKVTVNLQHERVYNLLLDYLNEHNIKEVELISSSKHSYIELKHGLTDIVKISILPKKEKSDILFNFNFIRYIIPFTIFLIISLSILFYVIYTGKPLTHGVIHGISIATPIGQIYRHIKGVQKLFREKTSDYFRGVESAASLTQDGS